MTKTKSQRRQASVSNLEKAHAAVRHRGAMTRDAILGILIKSKQPLVAREVQVLLAHEGQFLEASYVKLTLDRMSASKLVSSRNETAKEKALRKNGDGRGDHFQAKYYWAPRGPVPQRTVQTVVDTSNSVVVTRGAKQAALKQTGTRKPVTRKAAAARRPARTAKAQTGTSPEAVAILVARVAELERQLADIRLIAR